MKKIITITKIAFLLLIIAGFSSCEKDNLTLLTDGTWEFSNMTTDSPDTDIQTWIAFGKALMTDATLTFFDDETYEMTSPLMESPETGTWKLIGESQLNLVPAGSIVSSNSIDKLEKSALVLIETFIDEQSNPYTVTTSWVR